MDKIRDIVVIVSCAYGIIGWNLIIFSAIKQFKSDKKKKEELHKKEKERIEKVGKISR